MQMSKWIKLDTKSEQAIFLQIANAIEQLILSGRIKQGDFLMSVRELAILHKVNPNTVAKSYQELQRSGLATAVRGKGLQVNTPSTGKSQTRKTELLNRKIDEVRDLAKKVGVSPKELNQLWKKGQ